MYLHGKRSLIIPDGFTPIYENAIYLFSIFPVKIPYFSKKVFNFNFSLFLTEQSVFDR